MGPWIPQAIPQAYTNLGLKLALDVRISTPTALIYLETCQHSLKAIIWKRQLNFWLNVNKFLAPEMRNLIRNLKSRISPKQAFVKINK